MHDLWRIATDLRIAICPQFSADFLATLDPMCATHPDATCVIDHLGHVDVTNDEQMGDLIRLARHANVCVKLSGFYKLGRKQPPYSDLKTSIKKVYDAFGPRRLLWGSDCPYQLANAHTYADSIQLIVNGLDFLSQDDRRDILRNTAERIFFS